MVSFCINSIKSCVDIWIFKNEKFEYKVVDLLGYYNFDVKFGFIRHHIRKLWNFLCSLLLVQATN